MTCRTHILGSVLCGGVTCDKQVSRQAQSKDRKYVLMDHKECSLLGGLVSLARFT